MVLIIAVDPRNCSLSSLVVLHAVPSCILWISDETSRPKSQHIGSDGSRWNSSAKTVGGTLG